MCLILFSYEKHPKYRLILAANRDEFFERPTAPMGFWKDHPDLLAGRDLKSLGTWMGITRTGRLAAITNYREPGVQKPQAPSRGALISDFLISNESPAGYLERIAKDAGQYNGFNLLVGNTRELFYYSNRGNGVFRLKANIYGLSNRLLDTQWPTVTNGKMGLKEILEDDQGNHSERMLTLLKNQDSAPDDQLPDTGVSKEWEKTLSPIFIASPGYGTRCSTILTIDRNNHAHIAEHTWKADQTSPVLQEKHAFDFVIVP